MDLLDQGLALLQALQGLPAYALVLALLVGSGFFLPVNEDLLLLAAAALTLQGVMQPVPLTVVAWAGIVVADALVFTWGRLFGARLLDSPRLARLVPPARLAAVQARVRRWGPAAIVAVRFLPGLRTPVYFAAGSLGMPLRHMLLADGLAAAVSVPLLVAAVRYVGGNWPALVAAVQPYRLPLLAALAVLLVACVGMLAWRRYRRRARA